MTQFWGNSLKVKVTKLGPYRLEDRSHVTPPQYERSHGHIIYTAKMWQNSVLAGPIKFILGANMRTSPAA